ncbi:multidrug resistance-associated ABC transporter [Ramaria rubella]|nr:multidrug resistance-associated ABC transporter [Ramaria rubella]
MCSLPVSCRVLAPFRLAPALPLEEAVELERQFAKEDLGLRVNGLTEDLPRDEDKKIRPPYWRSALFLGLTLTEVIAWLAVGIQDIIPILRHARFFHSSTVLPLLTALTYLYALTRLLRRPPFTPPFDLFVLFSLQLANGIISLGMPLYNSETQEIPLQVAMVKCIHIAILCILLTLILRLPLNVPPPPLEFAKKPSPEDYTSLAGWLSFNCKWSLIFPFLLLQLFYIWDVSPTLKTRPTFYVYTHTRGSIFRRLLKANALDFIFDFTLTESVVLLDFCGPVFLRVILEGLEEVTSAPAQEQKGIRVKLYIYTFLAFAASLLRAGADVQRRWFMRRAASRVGTQLSAAVYDKALRIRDQSGVTHAGEGNSAKSVGSGNAGNSGADIGKIVNLMGIDIKRIQDQVTSMNHIYDAPLQLGLACVYLYSLLGPSAFAGFTSLVLAVPLTQLLTRYIIRITGGLSKARDERMGAVDEMFSSIKFIKFFAWEGRWVSRIMKAREVEMGWLRKIRTINICHSLLWLLIPNMISVVSFLVFILNGHELSVSVAFTAIRLFDMLRQPLSELPYSVTTFAQTKVSLDRLSAFFNEDEVPEDVCSFSRDVSGEREDVSVEGGVFRWVGTGANSPPVAAVDSKATSANGVAGLSEDNNTASASVSSRTAVEQSETGENVFELRNINVKLARGKLTVITGPTASGKTALLMALLGEMDHISGTLSIPKNPHIVNERGLQNAISYAAQTPWLQQKSIKDNIIFEYPLDQERYDAVVEACALNPDLRALEDGDRTEIGARGVTLSGGQKARVALARAVYAPTEYIILDDIFSAVDSHTARFLFESLLQGPLVAHRTVLLVTHHVELVLPAVHYLIQLVEGRIQHQGTVEELRIQGHLDYISHDIYADDAVEQRKEKAQGQVGSAVDANGTSKQARKLVEEEVRAEGRVRWNVYKTYLKSASYWTWFFVLLGITGAELCIIATRVWMSIWSSVSVQEGCEIHSPLVVSYSIYAQVHGTLWPMALQSDDHNTTMMREVFVRSLPAAHTHPLFYVAVYFGIGLLSATVAVITEWILLTGGLRSGFVLFKGLLTSLSCATFRFFDTTPTGRILNRFGGDINIIDARLQNMTHMLATSLASFVGGVLTVTFVVPWFLPIGAVLAYFYVRFSVAYLATGRDLRRLESTSRSPIIAGFSDLVNGIVTVRAFSLERQFLAEHYKRVDTNLRFWYFTWMLNRWLLLNYDVLGAVSVLAATIFALAGYVPAGFAALSIVSAMTFSSSVYAACRGYTELELCLNSVERVVEFLNIPKEPPALIENNQVPAYWPSTSDSDSLLVVEDLEVKYAPDLPSVLHGISFSLKARERVGLLGRTGCGKSTLAMSLLRFVEPTSGRILIDGIDTTSIGTHDLRSRITFIPQDATLFAGTIRDNLDPFNEHSDEDCLDALARVHLISHGSQRSSRVPSQAPSTHSDSEGNTASIIGADSAMQSDMENKITIKLESTVSVGGLNFSNGQRQLLAMARALLRQSGVVIFDEATSSIDKAADLKIQAAIREEFNSSLLLTIAHRLGTIIDFDRLIVLDKGRIVDFDTPYNLIRKERGVFREMCIQSGTFEELEMAAKARFHPLQ